MNSWREVVLFCAGVAVGCFMLGVVVLYIVLGGPV